MAKHVRLSQVTYPNGREVRYGNGTAQAVDDIVSRLAGTDDGDYNRCRSAIQELPTH